MNSTIIFGIIGISATIIIGFLTVYISRDKKYPGAITFIHQDTIGLFNSIVQNMSTLEVLLNGTPVNRNQVLFKGYLLNSGTKDITPMMVSDRLKATVPDGFRFLEAKVVQTSPKVNANVVITSDTEMEFDLGMFRKDEKIKFETIVEVAAGLESDDKKSKQSTNPARELDSVLQFSHRIADTRKIDWDELPYLHPSSPPYRRRKAILLIYSILTVIGVVFIGLGILVFRITDRGDFYYHINLEDGRSFDVTAIPYTDDMVRLSSLDGWFGTDIGGTYNELLPQDVFLNEMDVQTRVKDFRFSTFLFVLVFGTVFNLGFMAYIYIPMRNARRLYEKLSIPLS